MVTLDNSHFLIILIVIKINKEIIRISLVSTNLGNVKTNKILIVFLFILMTIKMNNNDHSYSDHFTTDDNIDCICHRRVITWPSSTTPPREQRAGLTALMAWLT